MSGDLLKILRIAGEYAVCRLEGSGIPVLPLGGIFCLARTRDEVSLVCETRYAPSGANVEPGWALFRIDGSLDFSLCGVLLKITQPLAREEIPVFAFSTYDTDYFMVKCECADRAAVALCRSGFSYEWENVMIEEDES
jgi:hypothetical protein